MMFVLCLMLLTFVGIREVGSAQNTTTAVNVGVVLNLNTVVGKTGLSCIHLALSDFYASHPHYRTRLVLHFRDSHEDVLLAAAAAQDLIKNEQVQAILGPETSMEANFVIHLGSKTHVPIITYSATSPSLASISSPYFMRATLASSAQVKAIAAIVHKFGWRQAVPVYIDNEYGQGIIPFLIDALQEVDARVPYRSPIASSASDDHILAELYKLMSMQTRVFVLHMSPALGSRLVSLAHQIGMMGEGYVWIMTGGMTNFLHCLDRQVIDSMHGALGVTPYVAETNELKDLTLRWKKWFQKEYPNSDITELSIYGLWAYDAATALAMAMEKVGDIHNVSRVGPKLMQALSTTRFKGVAGDFNLTNGQLQAPAFRIVNVGRTIGFWTADQGLVREINSTNSILKPIIWPGDNTSIPKGWEIPTNGRKLRIGVPVKQGLTEFVNVSVDPITNRTKVTGFCIDVFDAVIRALDYAVAYEYIPFMNHYGESAGNYSDLIHQVYLEKYDAVVGDTTILADRSRFVEFTLPYTESGVWMIVPVRDKREKNAWVFLKPLTWDLWATTACFFVFIGFAVWVLEHRINDDFRGPPSYQVATSVWFSFSTMVFAHRERVVSNLGRLVVIVWAFVVLILTQSYTASLTSMLTVEQLLPTFNDLNELVKKGENVGYLKDSFVPDILKKYNFDESKLIMYNSTEQCDKLLSSGSKKGGIAAAVDELPYMKLFLAKNCFKYTILQQIYKTDGFGFVFPRGSPLVGDISRAILKVREGAEMEKLEKQWLGKEEACSGSLNSSPSSRSLGLDSFWGLFLIVGVAASLALIAYVAMFLYEHKNDLGEHDPVWRRIGMMLRRFDEKDLTSHTFRKREEQGTSVMCSPQSREDTYSYSPEQVMAPAVSLGT